MGHQNGKIPDSDLADVAIGVQLLTGAANAYRALVSQAAHEHVSVKPAGGVGSGYRDLAVQELFYAASHGDRAAIQKTHLNPDDRTPVAAPGGSSHGWGDRIDLLFDGSAHPGVVDLNLAARFGFKREFGSADPNHFKHDGVTAIHPPHAAPAVHHPTPDHHPLADLDPRAGRAPRPGEEWVTVTPADGEEGLSGIAEKHRLTLQHIESLNPQLAHDFDHIEPGWKVRIK